MVLGFGWDSVKLLLQPLLHFYLQVLELDL